MKSIIQEKKECFITGRTDNLQKHHIFFGPYRKLSERYGLTVWLTLYRHTCGNDAVHNNRETDLHLKVIGQRAFEKRHGTREDFIGIMGRNYIDG